MDTAWIGVIGTLAGGILVGFISWAQKRQELRFQKEQEDRRHKLAKLEELHLQINHLVKDYSELELVVFRLNRVVYPNGQGIEFYENQLSKLMDTLSRIRTLQSVHVPEMKADYEAIATHLIPVGPAIGNTFEGKVTIVEMSNHIRQAQQVCIDFLSKLENIIAGI